VFTTDVNGHWVSDIIVNDGGPVAQQTARGRGLVVKSGHIVNFGYT